MSNRLFSMPASLPPPFTPGSSRLASEWKRVVRQHSGVPCIYLFGHNDLSAVKMGAVGRADSIEQRLRRVNREHGRRVLGWPDAMPLRVVAVVPVADWPHDNSDHFNPLGILEHDVRDLVSLSLGPELWHEWIRVVRQPDHGWSQLVAGAIAAVRAEYASNPLGLFPS